MSRQLLFDVPDQPLTPEDMPDYSPRNEREYDHDDDPDFGSRAERRKSRERMAAMDTGDGCTAAEGEDAE